MNVKFLIVFLTFTNATLAYAQVSNCQWDTIRPLSEINTAEAEAYPFISEDGLRIYFTQQESASRSIYMMKRPTRLDSFADKQLVSSLSAYQPTSSWFSSDELEMFYMEFVPSTGSYLIKHTTRTTLNDTFSVGTTINLLGIDSNTYKVGPSLTQDQSEMILFVPGMTNHYLITLNRTGSNEYTVSDTIVFSQAYKPGPGKFSKDGLTYYFDLEDTVTGKNDLYFLSRLSLGAPLANPSIIDSCLIDSMSSSTMPHLTPTNNT